MNEIYAQLQDPEARYEESPEKNEEWQAFHSALWTKGKPYEPKKDAQNPQLYNLFIRSNFMPTDVFRQSVLVPMAHLGIISETAVKAFE